MKKLWKAGALLATAVLLFTGCGNSKTDIQEATTEAKNDEIVINYSNGLDDAGKLEGVLASDIVTLCDYKNITIPKAEVEPAEEEITTQINSLLQNYGDYEGEVKDGNTVNIDYSGSIDGEQFSGGTASGQSLTIGSKSFIDTFEDQIIGHKPGENFDVVVTFPEDYHAEDLAGKEAVFNVTLNFIIPELSDEFVAKNFSETNGISTVKELKNVIKENLIANNKNTYLWEYMLDNCTFAEIPEEVMDARLDVSVDALRKQYHDYMGYGDEQILAMYGYESMDELRDTLREDTENNTKYYLISAAIADAEGIEVDEAALGKYLGEGYADSYYEMYGKPYVSAQILNSMIGDYLAENATVK